jgi:hypothetical protein
MLAVTEALVLVVTEEQTLEVAAAQGEAKLVHEVETVAQEL